MSNYPFSLFARFHPWQMSCQVFSLAAIIALGSGQSLLAQDLQGESNFQPPSGLGSPSRLAQGGTRAWESNNYQPPFGLNAPGNLSQGGTRSAADGSSMESFLPLVPQDYHFGVTTEAYPSFLVYVPAFSEMPNVDTLEFLLLDDEGNEIYRSRFAVELGNQILRIDLPESAGFSPLEVGQDYLWLLEGFTQDFALSDALFAHGWVRRVPVPESLGAKLAKVSTPQERAIAYADAEIWYDAIAQLEAGFAPEDKNAEAIVAEWETLLQAAGVKNVSLDLAIAPVSQKVPPMVLPMTTEEEPSALGDVTPEVVPDTEM